MSKPVDVSPTYPATFNTTGSAGYDAVVSVAAITRDGRLASYSNYGLTNVDLGAPGGDRPDLSNPSLHDPATEIVSTIPPDTYGPKRGNNRRSPLVQTTRVETMSMHLKPLLVSMAIVASDPAQPALIGGYRTIGPVDIGPGSQFFRLRKP